MTKLQQIRKAMLDILETCPNFDKKVYLLEDFNVNMRDIEVMYDSFAVERKGISLDKNGYYINGRSTSSEGKMYFRDFDNFLLSEEMEKKVSEFREKEESGLATRIPSKDIKVGMVCHEFNPYNDDYYVYLGKYLHHDGKKYNSYASIDKEQVFSQPCDYYYCYHTFSKDKIRFDKIANILQESDIVFLRQKFLEAHAKFRYTYNEKFGEFVD